MLKNYRRNYDQNSTGKNNFHQSNPEVTMKTIIVLFLFGFLTITFSQDIQDSKMFSKFNLSILGGANFKTIPTVGGTIQLEGKTNITPKINLNLSVGYSNMFEGKEYLIKSYSYFNIDNTAGYQLSTYSINKIKYSVVPVNLGIEYVLREDRLSPFGLLEIGYNFYSSQEQIVKSTGGEVFNNKNEIPAEYLNSVPKTLDGSSFGFGLGLGVKYIISSSLNINIRYVYRYNESIINTNQLLFGITF
jgi:opacity protein-like surface antigen